MDTVLNFYYSISLGTNCIIFKNNFFKLYNFVLKTLTRVIIMDFTFSRTFKQKVQTFVTQNQFGIYFMFQSFLGILVSLVYPGFDTFLVLIFWWNLSAFSYLLFIFSIPILPLAGTFLLLARLGTLFCSGNFKGLIFLFLVLLALWGISVALKRFPKVVSMIEDFKSSQKILKDHLKEIPLIGSLVLQVDLCLLLLTYFLFLEYNHFICLLKKGWQFFLPLTVLWPLTFLFVTVMENIICIFFNTTYIFNFINRLLRSTQRIMSVTGCGFSSLVVLHEYSTGGRFDPILGIPGVKRMQIETLGAHANTRHGVNMLKTFRDLGGTCPPCYKGTTIVDVALIEHQIDILKHKKETIKAANQLKLAEIRSRSGLSSSLLVKNYDRLIESISTPSISNESEDDDIIVGVRPSQDPISKKKDDK